MVSEKKTGNVSSFLSFVDLSNFELTPFITNYFFHGFTYLFEHFHKDRIKSDREEKTFTDVGLMFKVIYPKYSKH